MRVSIKTKQVLGVTAIVFLVVSLLSGYYVVSLAGVRLGEAQARATSFAKSILHRAAQISAASTDLQAALAADDGLRSTLEASAYFEHVMYAAVVDPAGVAIAHSDPAQIGLTLGEHPDLAALVESGPWAQARAIYTPGGLALDVSEPLLLGTTRFGSVRVAVSTLLIRDDLERALWPAILTALGAMAGAVVIATVLAQWLLRPILMIRAGLARLGRGESGVTLALSQEDEFGDLGESFNAVSARLEAERAGGQASRASMSKRLAALGRVSSGIAHEVKNPLNAMMIHLELLKQQVTESPAAREHVSVIATQMRRLDEVVQGFLNFTRPEDLTLEPVAVADLVSDLQAVIAAEAGKTGVTVEVDCPADVPRVHADAALIRQAFLNLAINACQAMPTGGRLRISARRGAEGFVDIRFEDTGTGIDPEHLEKIFNLYFTTKKQGSGIGLALVYRTIHLHNGDIEVQSVPGRGTTFRVMLPAAA